ncbi:UbiA family prenyltransferase [Streptomyces sp. YIM 121038]|uniref:UbiA family prenyltransferase n=1 Tax=Streptomyces sp. YIM 121038 TaxID=2136401 RepID=UPI0014869D5A|nr:UbiA family prenyltransferase [Streptomyces sp. YIM 121038]
MPGNPARPLSGTGLVGRIGFEARVTGRMMAANAPAAFLSPVLFTAVACVHHHVGGPATALHVAVSTLWFALFLYVFDASNQVRGATEDALNKPYRPIPSGLLTPQALMRRFWCAMLLYALLGLVTATLLWVLLWQAATVVLHFVSAPRIYFAVKPMLMQLGIITQLAAAWQLVAPLDTTAWAWVLVTGVGYNLAMIYEDVRDMEGDRSIGRRTLPLIVGHWPVRIWFAAVMTALPLALHHWLFAPSNARPALIAACTLTVTGMNWYAALRSLVIRNARADRITYQLYGLAFGVTLTCGLVLL